MKVRYGDQVIKFPDGMSEEEITQVLEGMGGEPPPPDSVMDNVLDVVGEGANAFNRGITEGLDFLGPGTINAALRLAGAPGQLPTFTGGLESLPGGQGNFMEEGTARDVVQGAGGALSAVPGMISAGPRNLAKKSDALLELTGFGAGTSPTAAAGSLLDGDFNPSAMVRRADDIGFPLSPGDRTGNQTLKRIDAAVDSTPMLFNPMHRMQAQRQQMMNNAAAESIGLPAGTPLIDEWIGDTADSISDTFRNLENIQDLDVDETFVRDLLDAGNEAKSRLFSDPDVNNTINKVFDKVDDSGRLNAVDYQDMSSELKAKIRGAWKGESPDAFFAKSMQGIVDALDRLAMNEMDPSALSDLRVARRKWKALNQLEKSRALRESGDVSAPLLGNYLRRTDKGGYLRGKNRSPVYENARLNKAFPSAPNSGTADRQFLNQLKLHPMNALIGAAVSPVTSLGANAYMAAPGVAAGIRRAVESNPVMLGILADAAERPGAYVAGPLRNIGGWLEDE